MTGRVRFWMLLGGMVACELAVAAWIGGVEMGTGGADPDQGLLLLAGAAGVFAIVAFQALLWTWLDLRLFQPLCVLEHAIEIMLHHPGYEPEVVGDDLLGGMPEGVRRLGAALGEARYALQGAVEAGAQGERSQRKCLEEIVRALREGLMVCDERGRVLLYNPAAVSILGGDEALGLGRDLRELLPPGAVEHALAWLHHCCDQGRRVGRIGFAVPVGTVGIVHCRIGLLPQRSGGRQTGRRGYVVTLEELGPRYRAVRREYEALRTALRGLEEEFRRLSPMAEPGGPSAAQATQPDGAYGCGMGLLRVEMENMAGAVRTLAANHWVLVDLYAADLVQAANRLLGGESRVGFALRDEPLWLRGDSHALTALLSGLARMLYATAGVGTLELRTRGAGQRVALELCWAGPALLVEDIGRLRELILDALPESPRLGDVLTEHGSELRRLDAPREGWAGLSMLLPASEMEAHPEGCSGSPGVALYDFTLPRERPRGGPLLELPLRRLDYVVFDTETTGLRPSEGDEIVSIGAVRIVNQRLLTAEVFDRLVKPRRSIPKRSTRFHGITDEQVAHAPPVENVLPLFHRFVGDAVLVAHNAIFDMKFLHAQEDRAAVRFDNPLLDVLLLSAFLHEHLSDHSLDGIAGRLGVEISDRHTALGDARGTARVFLALVDLLEQRGITTLGAAAAACDRLVALRRRQEVF